MDRLGRVYLSKNRSVPPHLLPGKFEKNIDRDEAVHRARRSLPKRDPLSDVPETERLWFPRDDELVPVWKVRLTRASPCEEWIVYLSARNGAILNKYDNLAQAVRGRGQVFDPSPVAALGDHALLLNEKKSRAGRHRWRIAKSSLKAWTVAARYPARRSRPRPRATCA
jgi:Zn-dependent metalloprotease